MKATLVVGYGNTIRSDDGVGVWIAERIAELSIPDVEVLTCHQLHLELVPDLVRYRSVILIDASASGDPIVVRRSEPTEELPAGTDHHVRPETLLQLARELYGVQLDMHLVTVRGEDFNFGRTLSPAVRKRAETAVKEVTSLLHHPEGRNIPVGCALN